MRLAVIADIHGNLPALEAVLADLERRGADRIVNLGDCVSGPLWPRETMELLDTLGLPTVRGNHDRWLAETPRERMYASDAFAHDRLTDAQRRTLGALPAQLDLGDGIVAVHGTPRDDNEYLLDDVVDGGLMLARPHHIAERLGEMHATLLLCGHTHQARIVRGARSMLIANPGSVGCPGYVDPTPPAHVSEAGSPHARYAMLTLASGRWSMDLIAIEYDWTSASKRATDNGRTEWAQALATGFVR
jgi:predicted phosphodiesterase